MSTRGWLVFTEGRGDEAGMWSLFQTIAATPEDALREALKPENGYGEPDRKAIVCPVVGSKAYELTPPRQSAEIQCEIGLAGVSKP